MVRKIISFLLLLSITCWASAENSVCLKKLSDTDVINVVEKARKQNNKLPAIPADFREVKITETYCHYRYVEYVKEGLSVAETPIIVIVSKKGLIVDYIQGRTKQSLVKCAQENATINDLKQNLEKARSLFPHLPKAQSGAILSQQKMRCFDVLNEAGDEKNSFLFDSNGDLFSVEKFAK